MAVKPVPDGYRTVTPYLTVSDLRATLDFVEKAFQARVTELHSGPDGKPRHAEVEIGDSKVMMGQANEKWGVRNGSLYLYLEDTDGTYARALAAGAKSIMEPADQFYGDRSAGVEDADGNQWWLATHVEDVSPEELQRRMASIPSR
ncbi:MAG TPA: VOC family protein [Thermoanaerobaculia bacterium]|nr:VOC family protein [Thermoanaerobaculia bacterium]